MRNQEVGKPSPCSTPPRLTCVATLPGDGSQSISWRNSRRASSAGILYVSSQVQLAYRGAQEAVWGSPSGVVICSRYKYWESVAEGSVADTLHLVCHGTLPTRPSEGRAGRALSPAPALGTCPTHPPPHMTTTTRLSAVGRSPRGSVGAQSARVVTLRF